MSFKIVQLTEHNTTYLTAVPSAWELSGNLYWPNTTNLFIMQKLIQNSNSNPERYWLSQPCVLKKANIITFAAAEAEIELINDSKGYYNVRTNLPLALKRHIMRSDCSDRNLILNKKKFKCVVPQEADANTNTLTSKQLPKEANLSCVLENINKNIDQILNKQNKILMKLKTQNNFNDIVINRLDQLNNSLSANQTKSCQSNMNKETSSSGDSNDISVVGLLDNPVSCPEEINNLENNLNDSKKMENLISKMKQICGETGSLDSTNCCYNLVDHFFTRSFLHKVSWSGGSRTNSRKIALKYYRNVLCVFKKLIILASKNFDENKIEDFFKTILKNSKPRNEKEIDYIPQDPAKQDVEADTISMQNLLNLPISNDKELDKLELDLEDDTKVKYLITKMKRICGETGLLDSTNCCYNLVDRFFTRSFLINVSWSGSSRSGSSKFALKNYTNVLDVFNGLVKLASKDFDENKSKEFFQIVLRNSKRRYRSEIDHIPRKSAKKVRRQTKQFHTDNEDSTLINGVDNGDVDIKFEFESAFET